MTRERMRTLANISIFDGLDAVALKKIEDKCAWRQIPAKDTILHFGDDTTDVFFLSSGRARIMIYSANGKAVSFRDIQAGAVFGEFAAIDGKKRSASVEALETCLVASLGASEFLTVLGLHPTVTLALLHGAVAQMRSLTERVYEFSTLAVNNRIHAELLRLGSETRTDDKMGRIAPAPTHAEIANRISTHREAVSRELSRLKAKNIIRSDGTRAIVCDLARLKRLVDEGNGD